MSWKKNLFHQAAQIIPVSLLKRSSRQNLCSSFQHIISNEPAPHIRHLYAFKNTSQFESDLDYLLANFYPVTPEQVLAHYTKGAALPDNSFLLTFDDGLRECTDVIAPILLKKGVPAAFFIASAFLDNQTLFFKFKISLLIEALKTKHYPEATLSEISSILTIAETDKNSITTICKYLLEVNYNTQGVLVPLAEILNVDFTDFLQQRKPFMSSQDVQSLLDKGFAVGAHSIDHPYYKIISLEEQLRQTLTSMNEVQQKFNLRYRLFAFPHLDASVSQRFFDEVERTAPIDLFFGAGNMKKEKMNRIVHRFNGERPELPAQKAYKSILFYSNITSLTNSSFFLRKN